MEKLFEALTGLAKALTIAVFFWIAIRIIGLITAMAGMMQFSTLF